MFRVRLICVLCPIVLAASAPAQEKAKAPSGPSPRFATVTAMDETKGVIELTEVQTTFAGFQVLVDEVREDGVMVLRPRTMYKAITRQVRKNLALDEAAIFDAAGKKLNRDNARKRLRVGAMVLISADGNAVDRAYLRAAAPDILVIVSPAYVQPSADEPPVPGLVPDIP